MICNRLGTGTCEPIGKGRPEIACNLLDSMSLPAFTLCRLESTKKMEK